MINKYTKAQLWQIIKMLMEDYQNEVVGQHSYALCDTFFENEFLMYANELEENTYIDKYNKVRCKYCEELIDEGRCSCWC